MQQRQSTVAQLIVNTEAPAKSAPMALDAATLKLVAGGVETSGPYGGWASVAASGPCGGW